MIPHLRAHGVQITEDAFVRMWDAFIEGGLCYRFGFTVTGDLQLFRFSCNLKCRY